MKFVSSWRGDRGLEADLWLVDVEDPNHSEAAPRCFLLELRAPEQVKILEAFPFDQVLESGEALADAITAAQRFLEPFGQVVPRDPPRVDRHMSDAALSAAALQLRSSIDWTRLPKLAAIFEHRPPVNRYWHELVALTLFVLANPNKTE